MNSKLITLYNVDKLDLVFETTDWFSFPLTEYEVILNHMTNSQSNDEFKNLWEIDANPPSISEIFILRRNIKNHGKYLFKNPNYDVYCYMESEKLIGELLLHIESAVILKVDNRFLYSNQLNLIYDFESAFNLLLCRIKNLDICCDSNQNLPKKLDHFLHLKDVTVTRPGRKDKLALTDKGNLKLGHKVVPNLKTITEYERSEASYFYELTNSGGKKSMKLRGYNKSKEIKEKSKKEYILDELGFESNAYRFEISVSSFDLTKQSKNKSGWSHKEIYLNLANKEFLKKIFIQYINRFFKLKYKNQSLTVSQYLHLE